MHMAFLSRVFKNLQWYGMTKKTPQKCGAFLCLCGLSGFLHFALIAYFLRFFASQGHRKSTSKYSKIPPPRWRGDCCV